MISAIPAATSAPATPSLSGGMTSNADFNTFLKMLTAQLKNQDPMNPMEGTEFAVQLATFAGVEQQAQSNKLLQQLADQSGAGLGQSAAWIGKEARTTAPVWFGTQPLTLDIRPDPRADSVQLIALDAQGKEAAREEIGPGAGQIDWQGRSVDGDKLPDGIYSFRLESIRANEVLSETAVPSYARIVETEATPDGVALIFQGGGSALISEVDALRGPQ